MKKINFRYIAGREWNMDNIICLEYTQDQEFFYLLGTAINGKVFVIDKASSNNLKATDALEQAYHDITTDWE